MSSVWTQEFKDAYSQLQKLSATDANFRSELLADANSAIENIIGGKLPKGFTIKVVEQDPEYSVTIALPPLENAVDDELLSNVAGGYQSPYVGGIDSFEPNAVPFKVIAMVGVPMLVGKIIGYPAAMPTPPAVMMPRN